MQLVTGTNTVNFIEACDINSFCMNHISQLPYLPISLSALAESPTFMSEDPRIVRAGFWMLEAAWRSPVPGSIPSGFSALANITRLSEDEVRSNYLVLTSGWDLADDARLHHRPMEEVVESIVERFGDELGVMADGALMACQGGSGAFELTPSSEVAKKKRGKTAFPKDFALDRPTLEALVAEGYDTTELQTWLVTEVRNYALAGDVRQKDWQATVRKFMGSTITRRNFHAKFGYPLGQRPSAELVGIRPGVTMSPRQRLAQAAGISRGPGTFQQMTSESNSSRVAESLAQRFQATEFESPGAHP